MVKLFNLLIMLFAFGCMFIDPAIGQEVAEKTTQLPPPPAQAPWWAELLKSALAGFPAINAWLVAVLGFLMALSRAATELLVFVAHKTKSKKDDGYAAKAQTITLWAATITGWFSVGEPKRLADKKAELKK